MKKNVIFFILIIPIVFTVSVSAEQFNVLGRPLKLLGYITQGGAISLLDAEKYDTEKGLQSALMNLFIEGDYSIIENLKFYGSGMLTVDWIYQIKHNDSSWNEKLFNKSRDRLNVDDKYWQLLKEAHFTWTPGNFLFRIGKQIVTWGETDGFRLMDQINPLDGRRGFADVEFETTVIPIWLVRAEYNFPTRTSWLQDLNLQFVFNPNADFIPDQPPLPGNDKGGIWAPNIKGPNFKDLPPPFGYIPVSAIPSLPPPIQAMAAGLPEIPSRIGSMFTDYKEPSAFSSKGFEYGVRVRALLWDAVITLNYFYGLDNSPIAKNRPIPPLITTASDGTLLIHPFTQGKYPLFRFLGATFARDITPLKASFLGGVAPVLRLETFYAFSNTFSTQSGTRYEKSDEFRAALGVDWKVKIPFLNPKAYFTISPQIFYRRILDYPHLDKLTYQGDILYKNNWMSSLMINTSYFHNKLTPSFFWLRDYAHHANLFRFQLIYDYSHNWRFTIGTLFLHGEKRNEGFKVFDHKDQIYFKVSYKWG